MFVTKQPQELPSESATKMADPKAMEAVAAYLETAAKDLRFHARQVRQEEIDRQNSHIARARLRVENRRLACRCYVMEKRGMSAKEIGLVLGKRPEAVAWYIIDWRKEKTARAKLKRNLEIFKADLRGEPQRYIAERHKITARRVREIVAEFAARLHRMNHTAPFRP